MIDIKFQPIHQTVVQIHFPDNEQAKRFVEALNELRNLSNTPQQVITDLITAEELRRKLNICKGTERRYVHEGLLKPQRIGRLVYYDWAKTTKEIYEKSVDFLPVKLRKQKIV